MSPFIGTDRTRLLNLPGAAAVFDEVFTQDCYRLAGIPPGSIVIDVGAFYGEFGLLCHKERGCRVLALEPSWNNCDVLALNMALNETGKGFAQRRVAVSGFKDTRVLELVYRPDHPAGSLLRSIADVAGVPETVVSFTMASIVNWSRELFGGGPLCIKLDCEGAEREIFEDLSWATDVHLVTMEWHNYDGHLYAAKLEALGFHVELEGGGPKPRPRWDSTLGAGLLFAKRP